MGNPHFPQFGEKLIETDGLGFGESGSESKCLKLRLRSVWIWRYPKYISMAISQIPS